MARPRFAVAIVRRAEHFSVYGIQDSQGGLVEKNGKVFHTRDYTLAATIAGDMNKVHEVSEARKEVS